MVIKWNLKSRTLCKCPVTGHGSTVSKEGQFKPYQLQKTGPNTRFLSRTQPKEIWAKPTWSFIKSQGCLAGPIQIVDCVITHIKQINLPDRDMSALLVLLLLETQSLQPEERWHMSDHVIWNEIWSFCRAALILSSLMYYILNILMIIIIYWLSVVNAILNGPRHKTAIKIFYIN